MQNTVHVSQRICALNDTLQSDDSTVSLQNPISQCFDKSDTGRSFDEIFGMCNLCFTSLASLEL